jgi:hypothetical protein
MIAPQLQCYLFDASVALTGIVSAVCGAGESPLASAFRGGICIFFHRWKFATRAERARRMIASRL